MNTENRIRGWQVFLAIATVLTNVIGLAGMWLPYPLFPTRDALAAYLTAILLFDLIVDVPAFWYTVSTWNRQRVAQQELIERLLREERERQAQAAAQRVTPAQSATVR